MPVPGGSGDEELVLFTQDELALWAPFTTISEATYQLVLDLVTTAVRAAAGPAVYDALQDLSPLKLIALGLARRMLRNADGKRSTSREIDDYSETDTYATETLDTADLTADEVDRIRDLLGLTLSAAFTIRPVGEPDRCSGSWRCW